ncbi:MAG: hypothetical protein IPJ30_10380 [Acidobacteria bacterium]|nr:hypothetical protein [Acidobacteriota bacterium]
MNCRRDEDSQLPDTSIKSKIGNRRSKIEGAVFVYSAGKLVAEYTTAAPPTNPKTRYTATDMLGSPRVITDSEGNVIARRDFKPFGEEISSNTGERTITAKYGAADNLRQKFTTYQRDEETGLDFAEARMYENRHGRFTAVDPLLASGKSANPQTFNRFAYAWESPNKTDRSKRFVPTRGRTMHNRRERQRDSWALRS